jgi:glucosamine-6-phosphate deaminase
VTASTAEARVTVLDSPLEVARAAADVLALEVAERPDVVLALPTGRTPIPLYRELARRHQEGRIDLGRVRGFNLDELVLPRQDPRSFHSFMEQHAWGHTGLRRDRCDIPDGAAPDLHLECRRYEDAIASAGGLDLALLGVGADGHVAYNMPGPLSLPTHVVRLPDGLATSLGLPPASWPLRAITMGLGTIRAARALVVVATGESKAAAVRALVNGSEDPEWPCSFLGRHPALRAFVDRAAGSAL